jgi:integrase
MGNPWVGLKPPASTGPSVNVDRSFTPAQWRIISAQLDGRRQTATHRRLGLGLRWLYATGARLSELTDALVDDLRPPPATAHERSFESGSGVGAIWTIAPGTRREREVPVPADLLRELASHLGSRGLHPDPWAPYNRGASVLGKSLNSQAIASGDPAVGRDARRGISAPTFYTQAKAFFAHCARLLRATGHDELANSFDAASTHWLRHSHARHAIQAGLPLELAQHHLGHASMATTAIYADRSTIARTDVLSAFWESAELN